MKTNRRPPLVLLGALLATSYFTYHAVFGTHGLQAHYRLISRSSDLEREVSALEAMRRRLHQDIFALAIEPLQPDLVEEVARATLGLVRPGDRLVVREATGSGPRVRTAQ